MDLLRNLGGGPGRRSVVGEIDGSGPAAPGLHRAELIAAEGDFPAEQRRPEVGERGRVGTVKRSGGKTGNGHADHPTNALAGPAFEW